MGKSKNSKKKRDSKTSSGLKRQARARQELRRLQMKIKRWKGYQTDPTKKPTWTKKQHPRIRSRHRGWNTTGMENRIKILEGVIKKGRTA